MLTRAAIAALAVAFALIAGGCGITDPYQRRPASRATKPADPGQPAAAEHDGPSLPATRHIAAAAIAPTVQAALARYAMLYVNWSAATLPGHERRLASLSTGQARAQAERAAGAGARPATLASDRVANSGQVVAIARGAGSEVGKWAIVTNELTTGQGPYQGLPGTSNVTWATVQRLRGGWIVSGWYPGG